jgi:hypothetical protein
VNIRRTRLAAVIAGAGMLALAGCSHIQPSLGQYAIVTGHGSFSSTKVEQVVDPGVNVHLGSGTTTWYVPANVRNYVTGTVRSQSDRTNPQAELTGSSDASPGMQDYTYTYVGWELNPSHSVLAQFLPFCLKYACATTSPQNDTSNSGLSRSSTAGWNNMLGEIFPHAIDNATQDAIQKFGPGLWTDRAEWTAFGDDIAAQLPAEIEKVTGSSTPFFCGPGSTMTKCAPFTVLVNQVTPVDPGVQQAYNQEVQSAYAAQAGKQRLAAAKEVYGPDANWFLGVTDLINDCQSKSVACNIYVGNAPAHP